MRRCLWILLALNGCLSSPTEMTAVERENRTRTPGYPGCSKLPASACTDGTLDEWTCPAVSPAVYLSWSSCREIDYLDNGSATVCCVASGGPGQ